MHLLAVFDFTTYGSECFNPLAILPMVSLDLSFLFVRSTLFFISSALSKEQEIACRKLQVKYMGKQRVVATLIYEVWDSTCIQYAPRRCAIEHVSAKDTYGLWQTRVVHRT